jgi:hypothetical protein
VQIKKHVSIFRNFKIGENEGVKENDTRVNRKLIFVYLNGITNTFLYL